MTGDSEKNTTIHFLQNAIANSPQDVDDAMLNSIRMELRRTRDPYALCLLNSVILRRNRYLRRRGETSRHGIIVQLGDVSDKYFPVAVNLSLRCDKCEKMHIVSGLEKGDVFAPFVCNKRRGLFMRKCTGQSFTKITSPLALPPPPSSS